MEQINEETRVYCEGEHIIQKNIFVGTGKNNNYGENIDCPEGYKLMFVEMINKDRNATLYNCIFINEVTVECKKESIPMMNGINRIGYFNPGVVVRDTNLRKKY